MALADASSDMIDAFFKVALVQGGPYLVCAFLLAAVVYLFRGWKEEFRGRMEDAKAMLPVLALVNKAMESNNAEMSSRTAMSASFGDTLRANQAAVEKLVERMERLTDVVRDGNRRGQS